MKKPEEILLEKKPKLIVFCSTFPDENQPHFGIFVRNRMFRYAQDGNDVVVVSPRAWFPGQGIFRKLYPHKRPLCSNYEKQEGVEVFYPKYFSLPGLFKWADGFFMALFSLMRVLKLKKNGFNVIDAHFAYPEGYAATLLGKWLNLPVSITLRGTIVSKSKEPALRKRIVKAVDSADQVISVTQDLVNVANSAGCDRSDFELVGNGVDTSIFFPDPDAGSKLRESLEIPSDAKVIISVGGIIEHKGHHRVVEVMPKLIEKDTATYYLIVGGASLAGDYSSEIKATIERLNLSDKVFMLGSKKPDELRACLSASDVFVLPTRYEGWANVFLEAMACGLPVVTTNVGGNSEVISNADVGALVPFGDPEALAEAVMEYLDLDCSEAVLSYSNSLSWDMRISKLKVLFQKLL